MPWAWGGVYQSEAHGWPSVGFSQTEAPVQDPLRRRGTFAPDLRASERPMAMACLRLRTRRPERPLLSVPRLRSCMARLTLDWAFLPYRAMGFTLWCSK